MRAAGSRRGAGRAGRGGRGGRAQAGFGYVVVLVMLAVAGFAALRTLPMPAERAREMHQRELEGVGREFADALRAYARATPQGAPLRPRRLEDLLKDPRVPFTRRFLRRVYADPMTGRAEWGLVRAADGGIVAVFSLSGSAARAGGAGGGGGGGGAGAASGVAAPVRPEDRLWGEPG